MNNIVIFLISIVPNSHYLLLLYFFQGDQASRQAENLVAQCHSFMHKYLGHLKLFYQHFFFLTLDCSYKFLCIIIYPHTNSFLVISLQTFYNHR